MSTPGTVNFPTSLDDSTSLFEAANRARSTLSGSITNSSTSLTLASASLFPSSGAIVIEDEVIYYTGKSTNTLTGLVRASDGTSAASHSSTTAVKMWIVRAHHVAFRSAIIATETKLGSGSSTPTLGSFLTSRANGASTWGHAIGDTATADDAAWSSKGATTSLLQGADTVADSSSPSTGGDPSVVFQSNRSGGAQGNGSTIYGFSFSATGKNNYTGLYSIGHYTSNLTGVSGNVDITASRNYLLMNPASLGSATLAGYALWNQSESFLTGVNLVTTQNDINNSTGSDAPVGVGTSGRLISMAFGHAAGKHSTVDILTEALNSNNSYAGWVVRANGYSQRILDYTDASMSLQGTWSATNGSATVSGSGGHADVEAVAGDILSINGTNATVLSAIANTITLTANFSGSTGSSLTLTKKVQPAWFANNSYLWWNNAAASARYRLAGLNTSDVFSFDPDARGAVFGGTVTSSTIYGGSTTTSTLALKGTSSGSVTFPGAAYVSINPMISGTIFPGTVFVGTSNSASLSGGGFTDVLHLQGEETKTPLVTVDTYNTNIGGFLVFRQANGTAASPTATAAGDTLGGFGGRPYNTTTTPGFASGNRVAITLKSAEAVTDVAQGTYITLETTPKASVTRAERWRVEHGGWLIGKELSANPTTSELAAGDQIAMYVKADKLVFAYNQSGTIKYISIPLDGSTTTFTNSSSAP